MTAYELLLQEREYLDKVIESSTTFLKDAVEGGLRLCRHENHIEFFCNNGKYLSKKRNFELIKDLAQKAYEKRILRSAMEQKAVIEKFLACYNPNAIEDILQKMNPDRIELITKYENFCKSTPEATTEDVVKTDSGVDLARNLIAICEAFLQSKGGSL